MKVNKKKRIIIENYSKKKFISIFGEFQKIAEEW